MPGYSKAPRGLFVLPRVIRIFTDTSTSPSPPSRQRPSRYAIRAGRNLPDKEFRYLRTVIVTAAVHWGLSSKLSLIPLTFQHWAGVSPYTSGFPFAETYVLVKQSLGPVTVTLKSIRLPENYRGHPLFLSYGVKLPSSLRGVISRAFSHLGVSTCVGLRYGR